MKRYAESLFPYMYQRASAPFMLTCMEKGIFFYGWFYKLPPLKGMIIMCLRFVIFWILVNGLITPLPVSRGTETLSDLQFALENNLKI